MPETHRSYWVYIVTNRPHGTLYIGVTGSLKRRIWQHRQGEIEGFTRRYGLKHLVYFEEFRDVHNAIACESALKGWRRERKVALIEAENPVWKDLAEAWFEASEPCWPRLSF